MVRQELNQQHYTVASRKSSGKDESGSKGDGKVDKIGIHFLGN